jgi:hypothetical protein
MRRLHWPALNNGEDFDAVAAVYDPVTRGELGWVPQGYLLNAVADEAVFSLQAGEIQRNHRHGCRVPHFQSHRTRRTSLSPDALLTMQELALEKMAC